MHRLAQHLVLALVTAACTPGPTRLGGGDDTASGGDTSASDTAGGPGGGSWSETDWCGDMADLSAVEAAYRPDDVRAAFLEVSRLRYPPGVGFVEAQTDAQLEQWLSRGKATFAAAMEAYETVVHEGSHIWGFAGFGGSGYRYRVVDDDLVVRTAFLDNFDRSEILDRHPDAQGDFYASTYLTGRSGAQGFNTLLDEYNAYTHSLASRYCTRDLIGRGASTSAKDGILTFMWYVETYLRIAREDHPGDYAAILADAGHVEVILAVWDRAESWLDKAADVPGLGIDHVALAKRVYEADNLAEITRVRDAQ